MDIVNLLPSTRLFFLRCPLPKTCTCTRTHTSTHTPTHPICHPVPHHSKSADTPSQGALVPDSPLCGSGKLNRYVIHVAGYQHAAFPRCSDFPFPVLVSTSLIPPRKAIFRGHTYLCPYCRPCPFNLYSVGLVPGTARISSLHQVCVCPNAPWVMNADHRTHFFPTQFDKTTYERCIPE